MAAAGGGDLHAGCREELSALAVLILVLLVHTEQIQIVTAEVEAADIGHAGVTGQLLVHRAGDDAAVAVQQLLELGIRLEPAVHISTNQHILSGQTAASQQTAGSDDIILKVGIGGAGGVPLLGRGVLVFGSGVVELNDQGIALGLVVQILLHGAAVVDHGLGAHPLLAALNAQIHVAQVVLQQTGGALGLGTLAVQRFTEAALVQFIGGQRTAGRNECGLVLVDFVAAAVHRNVANARGHERGHLTVALAVLGQNLVAGKQVTGIGREIAVTEEIGAGHDFLTNGHQGVGFQHIQRNCRHCCVLLYIGDAALKTMPASRRASLSASFMV